MAEQKMWERYISEWSEKAAPGYEVLQLLGTGSTGRVYLVRRSPEAKLYAMKTCEKHVLIEEESRILKTLTYRSFPQWVDYFTDFDRISFEKKEGGDDEVKTVMERAEGFLVMEYIEGTTLQEYLDTKGKLDTSEALCIVKEILKCLMYLHEREPILVYRDLKPANIMIDREGNVRLIDVGGVLELRQEKKKRLCEMKEASRCTEENSRRYQVGTYGYAAPEQFWEGVLPGPGCDLYGAGKILAYLLTGKDPCKPPYDMLAYCRENRDVTPELYEVLQRSLAGEVLGRYSSAEEFLRGIKRAEKRKKDMIRRIFVKKQKILYKKCIWKSKYERIF